MDCGLWDRALVLWSLDILNLVGWGSINPVETAVGRTGGRQLKEPISEATMHGTGGKLKI